MLPHFPALLLFLVSSGGADHHPPPPPPPWRDPPQSLPSPREQYQSNGDKHDQNNSLGSESSTAPKIEVGGEGHSVVAEVGNISSAEYAYGVLLTSKFTSGMPEDRQHQQSVYSLASHTVEPMASTVSPNPVFQQRMSRPGSRPSFSLGRAKEHSMLKRPERSLRRGRSQDDHKTSTNRSVHQDSRGIPSYRWEKVRQALGRKCPTRREQGTLGNDTSSGACSPMIKSTVPFTTGITFFSKATPAGNSFHNGLASQRGHTSVYSSRESSSSSEMTSDDLTFVSPGEYASRIERTIGLNPRLRRASGGTETARESGDILSRSTFPDGVFQKVLNKGFPRGSAGPVRQKKEHKAPSHRATVDGKDSDVAVWRYETGEGKSLVPGSSNHPLLPVSRNAKSHTRALRNGLSPQPSRLLENNLLGRNETEEDIVHNIHLNKHKSRGKDHASEIESKHADSRSRQGRMRQKRKDSKISETSNKKSKGSLFRVDRAEGVTGESKEVLRAQPREKRDAEEAQKNEIGLVNAQLGRGHSNMAVGQKGKQWSSFDEGRKTGLSESTKVEFTSDVEIDKHNRAEGANITGQVHAVEPSWFDGGNSPGNLHMFFYKPNENNGAEGVKSFRTGKKDDPVEGAMEEEFPVMMRRKRWADEPRANPDRSYAKALPTKYSRIFTKNFPQIFSNYHYGAINKHNHQSASEQRAKQPGTDAGGDIRAVAHGSVAVMKADRKAARSLNSHANRSSVRAKGGNKHARGERTFIKTPQQRHARSRNRAKRKVPAREVWALAGDPALLPCDLSVRQAKDSVQMVMWLREGTHTPLFSVDYREQAGGRPQVWRDNTASTARRAYLHMADVDLGVAEGVSVGQDFRTRVVDPDYGEGTPTYITGNANFKLFDNRIEDISTLGKDLAGGSSNMEEDDVEEEVFGLVVRDVELNDSAIYRCRVDFLLSPTRNNRVNLTVVVPPLRVGVRWWMGDRGDSDIDGQVGPFREGDSPGLICYTRDAWPPPRVVWFEEDTQVDDSYATDALNEAVENTLNLVHLTRGHHRRRYTCVAANSNLTRPIAATVRLQMALDVMTVEMDEVGVLSAGVQAEVKCTVWGSSPPPNVTWTLAGTILPSTKPWVSDDGNRSVSMVRFTPHPRHDGTQLECSAHNPAIIGDITYRHPPADHRHSTVLSINYAPRVSVSLGRSLDATNIKEGDDLYFECSAIAKPPPHKVTWSHNGEALDSSAGVLVSNMTLVLQKVSRSNAGSYTCHATNIEGSAASPPSPPGHQVRSRVCLRQDLPVQRGQA
ncbi:uncharacterized protein [Panulirus ornatus]|uniref:uncharacterized protein n=1 Tax=Panulirus ornatus TaxID=150431 RepID=UPI003A860FB9